MSDAAPGSLPTFLPASYCDTPLFEPRASLGTVRSNLSNSTGRVIGMLFILLSALSSKDTASLRFS